MANTPEHRGKDDKDQKQMAGTHKAGTADKQHSQSGGDHKQQGGTHMNDDKHKDQNKR